MRYLLVVLAVVCPFSAIAGGFSLGGAADGYATAQELELQRRALEIDRRHRSDTYDQMMRDAELRRQRQLIEENNRMLREERWRRGNLLPPLIGD